MDCPVPTRPSGGVCPLVDAGRAVGCTSDNDCNAAPHGYCLHSALFDTCGCQYGCVRDSDCGDAGTICVCGDPVGHCAAANCASGADCESNCDCVGPTAYEFACQTPGDKCIANSECVGTPIPSGAPAGSLPGCNYTGKAVCDTSGSIAGLQCGPEIRCVSGRPFLVEGSERLAAVARRRDWRAAVRGPECQPASPGVRARVAEHWTRVALMEHASIAAFARFTLHLLSVGAPPDLVVLSQKAMGDETEHTRLAFALASYYAQADVGPRPLAIEGSLEGFTVHQMLVMLVREGCIGETLAATEAAEALCAARDPSVRHALRTIARDELRHADLAWRTLCWMVESRLVTADAARDAVADGLVAVTQEAPAGGPSRTADDDLCAFGVLGDVQRHELRVAAAAGVIAECAAALLNGSRVLPGRTDQRFALAFA